MGGGRAVASLRTAVIQSGTQSGIQSCILSGILP
ncbi:hypothetical protein M2271_003211 [Streptomyces sp. LBL]|nr:hypothetical protein [Streptomyces sp. LBL]